MISFFYRILSYCYIIEESLEGDIFCQNVTATQDRKESLGGGSGRDSNGTGILKYVTAK